MESGHHGIAKRSNAQRRRGNRNALVYKAEPKRHKVNSPKWVLFRYRKSLY